MRGGRPDSPVAPYPKVGLSSRTSSISGNGGINRKMAKIACSKKENSEITVFINLPSGAEEMGQQSKALSDLTEDLIGFPASHSTCS